MKKRFPWGCWMVLVLLALTVGAGAWWFFSHRGGAEEKKDAADTPTARVQVAPLRRGPISRTLTAYGTTEAAPGGTRSVSYPFECRVVAVQANPGQTVAAGDALLQIEPSTDARLALDTARGTQRAADAALADAQARFKAHLATSADLATAQSAARDARLKLDSLQSRLPDASGRVEAPAAGVVTRLSAGPGAVVAPGTPLAEIAVEKRLEARLGLSPADAGEVHSGQAVRLTPVEARTGGPDRAAPLRGVVRVVGASVDPVTRLVDAFVALDDPGAPVLIGTYLRAEIVVETKDALLAPRAAVLPEAEGSGEATLFTVRQGKAVKHAVQTGLDDGESVEILPGDHPMSADTNVVTTGNYELEDQMPVEIDPAASGSAPTAPASSAAPEEEKTP